MGVSRNEESVRGARGQRRGGAEASSCVVGELESSAAVVVELADAGAPEDDARERGPGQRPRDGDPSRGGAEFDRDLADDVDAPWARLSTSSRQPPTDPPTPVTPEVGLWPVVGGDAE